MNPGVSHMLRTYDFIILNTYLFFTRTYFITIKIPFLKIVLSDRHYTNTAPIVSSWSVVGGDLKT